MSDNFRVTITVELYGQHSMIMNQKAFLPAAGNAKRWGADHNRPQLHCFRVDDDQPCDLINEVRVPAKKEWAGFITAKEMLQL